MSHHLDSPLARQDPRLDLSDVYVFGGATGTVFILNVNPLSGVDGFHPEARYEVKVDLDGDAVEDLTLFTVFGPIDAAGNQTFEVRVRTGAEATNRDAESLFVAAGVTGESIVGEYGVRAWAGCAAEPFFIEPTVITAVKTAVAEGKPVDLGTFDVSAATNLFADTNVSSIVLEVPAELTGLGTIGFWGVSVLATDAGGWRQINRCATPLVNTIFDVTQIDYPVERDVDGDIDYNATEPSADLANYGEFIRQCTARVVAAMGTVSDPERHGERIRDLLFPDVLRYEVGTPAHFGVYQRNGRGLTDSTPETMFELILNTPVVLGLDASSAAGTPRDEFPYLSIPVPVPG